MSIERLTFAVIIECPDGEGNLCDELIATDGKELYVEVWRDGFKAMGIAKSPVFREGELLILNKYGREVNGQGRKPSKWWIGFEVYQRFESACQRAIEVTRALEEQKSIPPCKVRPFYVQTAAKAQQRTEAMVEHLKTMPLEEFDKLPIVRQFRQAMTELNLQAEEP